MTVASAPERGVPSRHLVIKQEIVVGHGKTVPAAKG